MALATPQELTQPTLHLITAAEEAAVLAKLVVLGQDIASVVHA
jgi:hypothetical protein